MILNGKEVTLLVCVFKITSYISHPSHLFNVSLQERLVAIIFGMFRQHKYNFVDVYREEACTGLKAIIKQVRLKFLFIMAVSSSRVQTYC